MIILIYDNPFVCPNIHFPSKLYRIIIESCLFKKLYITERILNLNLSLSLSLIIFLIYMILYRYIYLKNEKNNFDLEKKKMTNDRITNF